MTSKGCRKITAAVFTALIVLIKIGILYACAMVIYHTLGMANNRIEDQNAVTQFMDDWEVRPFTSITIR